MIKTTSLVALGGVGHFEGEELVGGARGRFLRGAWSMFTHWARLKPGLRMTFARNRTNLLRADCMDSGESMCLRVAALLTNM